MYVNVRESCLMHLNPLSVNATKWSNTLKQFVGNLPTNCLSVFDYFVKLWRKIELQGISNGFLKIKRKEAQISLITKDKYSEIHIGEFIIKSSDCEKLLGIKIDPKLCF